MQEIGITREEQDMINKMASISNELVPLEEAAMNQVKGREAGRGLSLCVRAEYSAAIGQINTLKEAFLEDLDVRTQGQVNALVHETNAIKMVMFAALAVVRFCS